MKHRLVFGAVLASGLLCAPGCGDEAGPLDRETVAALARTQGDAQGTSHTGNWEVRFEVTSCSCPANTMVCIDPALQDVLAGYARLIEGDGLLVVSASESEMFGLGPFAELSGPIDADGTFSVGSVGAGFGLLVELLTIARLDGSFDGDDAFTGVFAQRIEGTLDETKLDCATELQLDATRTP